MLSLALLPLAGYFSYLAFLNIRLRPTVVSGVRDFMLLACGLFGILTLGPGRLLIPMDVLAFWGLSVWVFWTAFYFAAAYSISSLLERRIIIYHCPLTGFIPKLIEIGRGLDPQCRFEGNVLFLPGFGIQCSIVGNALGLFIFTAAGPHQGEMKWQYFQQALTAHCRDLRCSSKAALILWSTISAALFVLIAFLAWKYPVWLEVFADYWG